MIDHLDQPGFGIPTGVEFHQGDQKGLLDDVTRVFLLETMLPGCPSNEG